MALPFFSMLRHLALLVCIGLALVGCRSTVETAPRTLAVAVEGFVGVPAPVGQRVMLQLSRIANERNLRLVSTADEPALLMRGYLALDPTQAGGVAYVWDVFERDGRRAQRLAGRVAAPTSAWERFDDDAARSVAAASADALARYLAAPTERVPAAPTAATVERPPEPATSPRAAPRRVAIEAVAGLDPAHARAVESAIGRALAELGYVLATPGIAPDVRLAAEGTVNPPEGGRRRVALVWTVKDGAGRSLGEIRQMARLPEARIDRDPARVWAEAIDRALPGFVALVPPR